MKKLFIPLLITFVVLACNKQKSKDGVVKDYGPIALDGCGWVIEVNGEVYSPTNLDSVYQSNDLNITFDFKKLKSTIKCGLQADVYDQIEILKIH